MRVAVVSHASVVTVNRGKLRRLPDFGVETLAVVPRRWSSAAFGHRLTAAGAEPLESLAVIPAWLTGQGSLFVYSPRALWRALRRFVPAVVHVEEEPWSLAAFEITLLARRLGVPLTFFTWENIDRRLPWPFCALRRRVLREARAAIAGNAEAAELLRASGFDRRIEIVPQLGVDEDVFHPRAAEPGDFVVGYVGRLVDEKGVDVLLRAFAGVRRSARLLLVGGGPAEAELRRTASQLGLSDRLEVVAGVPHALVAGYLRRMSVLVLPSRTTARWKEQFGHVLVEAMACGVVVVGSDSGAIPEVIGDAGLVFKEGKHMALASVLIALAEDPGLRRKLALGGRERVLRAYTDRAVAGRLATFWRSTLADPVGA